MPLIQGKSDKAFSKNVSAEMNAGKGQKQSLAIAYAIKRKNQKKMSSGGFVPDGDTTQKNQYDITLPTDEPGHENERFTSAQIVQEGGEDKQGYLEPKAPVTIRLASGGIVKAIMAKKLAKGGMVEDDDEDEDFHTEEPEDQPEEEFSLEEEPSETDKRRSILNKIMNNL